MEDADLVAARYTNAATLADTVLLLVTRLNRGTATMNESTKAMLDELITLLKGSSNGAASLVQQLNLSPAEGRSLTEDLIRYDQVRKVKRTQSDAELETWTETAADVVQRFRDEGFAAVAEAWERAEIEPFLEALAHVDGLDTYEHDTDIGSPRTAL